MSFEHPVRTRPRFGRIPAAKAASGLSRASLYILAGRNPGLFKKFNDATIVDLDMLDAILAELPDATISDPDAR
jgi:hypothetical protein